MARRKKHTLLIESELDFDMIGICSQHSDYRLVWSLNDELHLHLSKCDEDYHCTNKKGEVISSHSMYEYFDEENRVDVFLVKNKTLGKFLVSEAPAIDYFLFLCNNQFIATDNLISELKSVSSIQGAYDFVPEELPSAENLVFV
jgi:hypothetical protein